MIAIGRFMIGPLGSAPAWWRQQEQDRVHAKARLDRDVAASARLVAQYPGRRQSGAARISPAAIYAARAVRAALPLARDPICARECHEQADGREACDALYCRATVRGRLDQARPTPRSIHDVLRDEPPRRPLTMAAIARAYYTNRESKP